MAKIYEASRPEFNSAYEFLKENGKIPIDTGDFLGTAAVLTARDIAELFRKKMQIRFCVKDKKEK